MTDPPFLTPDPLAFQREYTTDVGYATRFTRAYFAYIFSRPRRLVPLAIILAILILTTVAEGSRGTGWVLPVGYAALLVIMYALVYFLTVRQIRARIPVGSIFGIGFRSATFVMRSPQVTSEVAYSLYRSCERRGGFVILRQRISRVTSILPAEIFTDESFEFMRAKISPPAPTP